MIRYWFDLYPRDDPKDGTRLVRFTKLQSAEYRGEANGTGAGRFTIRADDPEADNIDPLGLQYVRVVREDTSDSSEVVVGGFWLDNGDFEALTTNQTRKLTFGGAGTLAYLQRAIMASHTYLSNDIDPTLGAFDDAMDPFDDIWRLSNQGFGNTLGAMLWRVIKEASLAPSGAYTHRHKDGADHTDFHADDRPTTAIPDLTWDFDQDDDSSSGAWVATAGDFKAQVGESVLSVVKRLMEAGLYVEMDPDTFELHAWEAADHRRDRTGAAWGSSVIRFQAPTSDDISTGNIKSDAKRGIAAFVKRSWLLAGGHDTYGDATGTSDIPWEGFYSADSEDTTALNGIASTQLGARDDAGDTLRLRMRLGSDPSNGYYLPFEHILLDDLATVHTGTGQWDYNEDTFPVAALTISLRPGGDWDAWADLGSTYTSMAERAFQAKGVATHSHPPNPQLCPIDDPVDLLRSVGSGSIKVSGASGSFGKTNVNDGDDTTHWSTTIADDTGGDGVAESYWAADLGASAEVNSYRVLQAVYAAGSYTGTFRSINAADEIRIYGSDDADAWSWLTDGSKIAADPAANDWTLVATDTSHVGDTGIEELASPSTFRYWLFRAVSGGAVDWDVGSLELWSAAGSAPLDTVRQGEETHGTSNRASRCDHQHAHGRLSDSGTHYHDADQIDGLTDSDFDHGWYNVTDYGATGDGTTDDRAAIQDAIDACAAAGGGTVWFPTGTYYLGDTLQDTSTFNSLLEIPQNSGGTIGIRFLGELSTLLTDWAGTISGTPSVISAGTHDSHTLNNVFLKFERIRIQVPQNPKLSGIDATKAVTVRWDDLLIFTGSNPSSVPSNSNAIGLDMPWGFNDQNSGGDDLYIIGFHTGIRPSEQTVADAIYTAFCAVGAEFRGSGGPPDYLAHAASIQRFNSWFNIRALKFTGDKRAVHIAVLDSEHDDPDFEAVYDIDDASNFGRGFIGWQVSDYDTGEPVDDLLVNGGTGLSLHGLDAKRWRLANAVEIPTGTNPSVNPPSGRTIYSDSTSGNLSVRKPDGTTLDLEAGAFDHDAEDHSTVGHYELLMTGSSPPDPLEDGTGTDWLYVWVNS